MPKNVYTSVEQLIGNTPLLELKRLKEKERLYANIFAKLEYFNPAGSIKDRVALAMINDAEEKGILKPDSVIIEPTSGNTGIGLALVAAVRGYRSIIVMPDTMSEERRKLMTAYGAELVLTDGKEGMAGSIKKAEQLAKEIPNSFIPDQFCNMANPKAHYETTGPEIYNVLGGEVDIFIAGIGTGGTISGVGEYLKQKNPSIKIIGIEPEKSPLLTKGVAGPHGLQGIGANFVPKTLNKAILDDILTVSDENALEKGRLIAKVEGLLVGISAGAALSAAIELAKDPKNEGKNIVVLLPDTGHRYLSTNLF